MSTINVKDIPYNIHIENSTGVSKFVQMFKRNIRYELKSGDTLVIRAENSDETLYYLNLVNTGLKVIAEPADISFKVELSIDDSATVVVKRDNKVIDNETDLNMGDKLKIEVTAESGYEVGSVEIDGVVFDISKLFTVTNIETVVDIFVNMKKLNTLTITQPAANGEIIVTKGEDELESGDTVKTGDILTIELTADEGYEIDTLTVNDVAFANGSTLVVGLVNIVVAGTVKEKIVESVLHITPPADNGAISVERDSIELLDGATIQTNDVLTISLEPSDGYEIDELTVNGEPFVSGEDFTVVYDDVIIVGTVKEIA